MLVLDWFELAQMCASCYNHLEFVCTAVLLSPDNTVSLRLSTTFGFYSPYASFSIMIYKPRRAGGVIRISHLGLNVSQSLILCTLIVCRSLCQLLFQVEAPQKVKNALEHDECNNE